MNPYEILNVNPNCSDEELSKAYKALARKYHPDVNKTPEASKKMVEINCAYDEIKKIREGKASNSYNPSSTYQNQNYSDEIERELYARLDEALRYNRLFEAYQILTFIRNRNDVWYYYASILYANTGNFKTALNYIENAIKMNPNDPKYTVLKEEILSKKQENDKALEELAKRGRRYIIFMKIFFYLILLLILFGCVKMFI